LGLGLGFVFKLELFFYEVVEHVDN